MNSVTLFEISSDNGPSAISPGGALPPPYPPGRNMKKTATKVVASLFAFSLIAAAFALGADGVQMGTQMVAAAESPVHDNWKHAIINAAETDTVFLNERFSPALRALRTSRSEGLIGADHNVFNDFGNANDLYFGGDMDAALALTGQVAGRIDRIRSVSEIISSTVSEFAETVNRLS
ncbi:MAG: nitronate monooxygenase [Ilumatobacteraceae bacterium]|nr:nitronate monooxygenase [Ilumatobacteraceae bacterium]